MSGYSVPGCCKDNYAANVFQFMPQRKYQIHDKAERKSNKIINNSHLTGILLDRAIIMRHNLLIVNRQCGIVRKGKPMSPTKKAGHDKRKKLKEQGSLNPRPEKVKEKHFLDGTLDFFDPNDLVQVKYEMLRSVEKQGSSVTEASEVFGFSRPAFYQVRSQFQKGGVIGFVHERPGPKSAHKVTDDIVEFIAERVKEGEPLRARALVPLIKKKFNKQIHPRSIERAMGRRGKKK